MLDKLYQYALRQQPDREALIGWLAQVRNQVVSLPGTSFRRSCFDTFDWRLYKRNLVLEFDQLRPTGQLRLRTRDREAELLTQPVETMPCFPADLPEGQLRDRLMKLCKLRALLPVASIFIETAPIELRNGNGKTIARLYPARFHADNGKSKDIIHEQMVLEPLRGYANKAKPVADVLDNRLDLKQPYIDVFDVLCRQSGIRPGQYEARLQLPLQADERADQATGRLLLFLLSVMEVNESGMRDDVDTEFLHDFRIACRRSRTLVAQVRDIFPAQEQKRAQKAFAWLSEITGACRDMDVFLLELDSLIANAGLDMHQAESERLRDVLAAERREARATLLRGLRSERYERFKRDWRTTLEKAGAGRNQAAASAESVKTVADHSIWRQYKKMFRTGEDIDPTVDSVALHELRKTGKKLRYLLEAYQTLYPPDDIREVISSLKKLQDNLGAIVDATVQSEVLQHVRNDRQDRLEETDRYFIRQLIDDCDDRHHASLAEFRKRFSQFAGRKNRKRCKALFKPA